MPFVRLPPGFVSFMKDKAPEEATVRVLPNCTGKVSSSETGVVVGDALPVHVFTTRFTPASQVIKSPALQFTVSFRRFMISIIFSSSHLPQ